MTTKTIANALTAQQHYEAMCKVAKKAKTWNDSTYKEVVLLFRPFCSLVKVDQGFMSGC